MFRPTACGLRSSAAQCRECVVARAWEPECLNENPAGLPGWSKRIVSRGKVYLSNTELEGRFCLRVCIVNHLTRDTDIEAVVPEVLDAASEILSEQESK
jgi:hypothetical protein